MYKDALANVVRVERQISTQIPFPQLVLFDRIVAVLTPHLYEVRPPDGTPISFNSLQNFPQMLPSYPDLNEDEHFQELAVNFSKLQILPFCQFNELVAKMSTRIEMEALKMMRETEKVSLINIGKIIDEVLTEMLPNEQEISKESAPAIEIQKEKEETEAYPYTEGYNDADNPEDEKEKENQESEKTEMFKLENPFELVRIDPRTFVPDITEINDIGEELFYYNEEEENYVN